MISTGPSIDVMMGDLAALLDEEIVALEQRRSSLQTLSAAIAKRDDKGMEAVLGELERAQQKQMQLDARLRTLRKALADAVGISDAHLRMGRLIDRLPGEAAFGLEYRRQHLALLVQSVRHEHMRAAIMLSEASRVNRELLNGLTPGNRDVTTYGRRGAASWRAGSGIVDMES